ncbi:MAG: hypothetical protein AAGF12_24565 [Myxococcota bacterium]
MSLHLEDDKLQRYFDGDLSPAEAEDVKAAIAGSEDEQRRLEALDVLNQHLSLAADAMAADLDSDALFGRIEAGLADAEEDPTGIEDLLTSVDDRAADETPEKAAAERPKFEVISGGAPAERSTPARPEGWKIWIPVAGGLAAAAVVLFAILSGPEPSDEMATNTSPNPTAVTVEESGMTIVEAPQGSEVVEVDFGDNAGTVFEVEGEAGEPIAVVWISDDHLQEETL